MKRVLFVLKHRDMLYTDEEKHTYGTLESGLFNSARFVSDMLNENGFESKIVHVIDNNFIDREVTAYRPDVVIIEAFWVVPEKFKVLAKLHPKVKWIIRNHSKMPFLSNEGIAMDWILQYVDTPNVYVSSNSHQATRDVIHLVANRIHDRRAAVERCPYLPNYYPIGERHHVGFDRPSDEVHIGCFGAIRPLKNQLNQAIAAIKFADAIGKKLVFHINGSRIEGNGQPILKNIRKLFDHIHTHELVEHSWMKHHKFLDLVSTMDYGLQVSYSETFNIVAADMISQGVPVIVSREIDWVPTFFHADPDDSDDIAAKLMRIGSFRHKWSEFVCGTELDGIEDYNDRSIVQWERVLRRL